MAKITLLTMPLDVLHSNDADLVIEFLNVVVRNPDDRFPPFLEWAYVFNHTISRQELEALSIGPAV